MFNRLSSHQSTMRPATFVLLALTAFAVARPLEDVTLRSIDNTDNTDGLIDWAAANHKQIAKAVSDAAAQVQAAAAKKP
ncbi:hypothetical protein EYR40_009706 [Pleurotus pulmonarius]|nr:hypothetical protein EYR38_002747 [Pleurotus pulmonarius]KAF4591106.1 hypothetical protein EYR40_009706 [Pleurotus pulmonarius]